MRTFFNIGARLRQTLLPQDCLLCGAASGDAMLCAGCEADLPACGECCPHCALPSPDGRVCGTCLRHPPAYDATVAVWRYAFPVDRIVQLYKYGDRLAIAAYLATALAARLGDARASAAGCADVDVLVPMPLAPARLAVRGFNQAVEIARPLARMLRLPLAVRAAARVRETAPQFDLPLDERARNVRGAFACGADLAGKRVAIVDDVMTTGATLGELAATLKRAGAVRVENWIVARTVIGE